MSRRVRVCLLLIGCAIQALGLDQTDLVKRFMTAESLNGRSQLIGNINQLRVDRQLVEEPSSDSAFTMVEEHSDRSANINAENGKMSSNFKITAEKLRKRDDDDYPLWISTTPDIYYEYRGNKMENRKVGTQDASNANNNHYTTVWNPIDEYSFPVKATRIPHLAEDSPSRSNKVNTNNQLAQLQSLSAAATDYEVKAEDRKFSKNKEKNILYFFAAEDDTNANNNNNNKGTPIMLGLNKSHKLSAAEYSTKRRIDQADHLLLENISYDNRKYNLNLDESHKNDRLTKELIASKTNAVKAHHDETGKMNVLVHKQPIKLSSDKLVLQRKIDKPNLNKLLTGEKYNLQSDQLHLVKQAFVPIHRFNELTHVKNKMPHKRNGGNRLIIQVNEDDINNIQSRSDKLLLGGEAIAREHAKLVHDINSLLEYKGWSGLKAVETTTEIRDEEDSIYVEDLETMTQPSVMSTAAPRTPSVNLKIIPKIIPGKPAVALPLIVVGGDTMKHLTKPLPTKHPYPFVGSASTSFPMRLRPIMYTYPMRSKPTLWQRFVALFPKIIR